MRSLLFTVSLVISFIYCSAQNLVSNRDKINKAKEDLCHAIKSFNTGLANTDTRICINNLIAKADDDYKKYVVANQLFYIDTALSFRLHKEAYSSNPKEQNFLLQYAMELHRKEQYEEAALLYEKYIAKIKYDVRLFVWLADCYMNSGNVNKSIENWKRAYHIKNYKAIDFAIFAIRANTSQIKTRNDYKTAIAQGKTDSFFPLIFLDMNWKFNWWSTGEQSHFLEEDMRLAKEKLGVSNKDYKTLQTYIAIKRLEKKENIADSINRLLTDNHLIVDENPLPADGRFAYDLLRICFTSKILWEINFYQSRGEELRNLAIKTKDKDVFNIYAYLQAMASGRMNDSTDLLGWKEFNDERFAINYFMSKANRNKYDDEELSQAVKDFPASPRIYWVKTSCAKTENKELKPHLVELIKREFKTLGSDENRYSNQLNAYFRYLTNELAMHNNSSRQ